MGNENGVLQQRYGSLNDEEVRIRSRSISQEKLDEGTMTIKQCFLQLKYRLEKYFKLYKRRSTWCTEFKAGFIDFVTMAYILAVNASILKQTGGTCGQHAPSEDCLHNLQLSLITATAISSAISTALMGIFANLPIALAPGMGMNAYFVYTVVGQYHDKENSKSIPKHIPYSRALSITFCTGCIFLILSLILCCVPSRAAIRTCIEKLTPVHMKQAITVGIGLFLALIGFQANEGIGIIASAGSTRINWSGQTYLGIIGFVLMMLGTIYRCKPSILLTILLISQWFHWWYDDSAIFQWPKWPRFNDHAYDNKKSAHPFGAFFNGFFLKDHANGWEYLMAVVTFLIVDILDTTGALYIIADYGKLSDKNGDFEGSTSAFCVSAIGTIIGSVCGTSPVTPFVESAAGIQEGGKTGITAIVVSLFFIISLFFAPMFVTFPSYATGPVLIVIGTLMIAQRFPDYGLKKIFPIFVTIVSMPYLYSIAYGIFGGILTNLIIVITDWIINIIKRRCGPCRCLQSCIKYICCCCDSNNNNKQSPNDGIMDDDDDDDNGNDMEIDIEPIYDQPIISDIASTNTTNSTINDNHD